MLDNLPDTDCGLFFSCLKSWEELKGDVTLIHPDSNSLEYTIGIFNLANTRLERNKDFLRLVYIGENVPELLGSIMRPFIIGKASQNETRRKLEECIAKLEEKRSKLSYLKSP